MENFKRKTAKEKMEKHLLGGKEINMRAVCWVNLELENWVKMGMRENKAKIKLNSKSKRKRLT